MNKEPVRPPGTTIPRLAASALAVALALGLAHAARAAGPAPVDLGAAANFAILTKSGITNVPTSDITGNLGVSPIASTAITGFSLIADSTNTFSRSSQVTGKIFAANYAAPTPAQLTTAVGNMETAYTDAAGRALPDFTELHAGNLSGKTLVPGLYKWSTGVLITADATLAGAAGDVWIFQIAGNLTLGSGAKMLLSGGAQARNIFWQVGGGVGVEIGTSAHVEGNLLAKKAIHLRTLASLNGRALSQTAVTLAKNVIVIPRQMRVKTFSSVAVRDGSVLESSETSGVGGAVNATATTFRLGDDAANRQYRAILHFDTSGLPDRAVVTRARLMIRRQGVTGQDPFRTHGHVLADIRKPFFGPGIGLAAADFQSGASALAVASFGAVHARGWHDANVNAAGRSFVNRTGPTQFRLRFGRDDNNDRSADYAGVFSGNARAGLRPKLVVDYFLPASGSVARE